MDASSGEVTGCGGLSEVRRGRRDDVAAAIGSTLLWIGMLVLGGWWAAERGFRQPRGLASGLGAAVLALTWATLGTLALGLLGWLTRGSLLAWAATGLAIAGALRLSFGPTAEEPKRDGRPWDRSATVALALVFWVLMVMGVPDWLLPLNPNTDGPIYHLYFAARWWKAGRVFLVATPFGETAATYFPHNGELWFTTLMTLMGGDRLAKIGQAPFLLLAASAAFAIIRRLQIGVPAATIAVCWFVTCVPALQFSFEPDVDTIFVGGYLTAVYFLLSYALGDGGLGTLALGALATGGAWGTKATGTVFVPPLLALGLLAVLRRRAPLRIKLGHMAALILLPIVLAGYWFGRNAWLTGNPLYPLQVSAFGRVLLRGGYDSSAMRLSQFYGPASNLRALFDILLIVLDPRELPVWAAALLGFWAVGRRPPMARWIWLLSALAVADAALYWLLIPYRTQHRFLVPALGVASVPLAALLDRSRWLCWCAVGLLALHLLTPYLWPLVPFGVSVRWGLTHAMASHAYGFIRIPSTLADFELMFTHANQALYLISNLLVGLVALALAGAWGKAVRRPAASRWAVAFIATVVVISIYSAMTWAFVTSEAVFPNYAPYLRGWQRLDQLAGPGGSRIAYAGNNRTYYLMGRGLRNDVFYVNIDAHAEWLLHDYHQAAIAQGQSTWRDSRPGWGRLIPDYQAWLANLTAARIDLLVVTPAIREDGLFNRSDPAGFPIERVWADAHPKAFTPVYGAPEKDSNFRIYRVRTGSAKSSKDQYRR
jgi:hypothetical protein